MKYVKKDIEQLIKTNIGVKIRKLKLCGRIDSKPTNKILLFFKDNVLNLYVLEYNVSHHNFVSFDKIKIVYGFFNPSGNYIRRRVFYNDKTFKFNVIKRIKFYDYNKSFEYVYYDKDKCAVKHSILCVGGATSIDRTYRLSLERQQVLKKMAFSLCSEEEAYRKIKRLYWDDEAPYYDEERLKMIDKTVCPIDIVCSHTAPSFCYPQTKEGLDYWLTQDKNLSEDLDNERKVFDKIYSYLKENGFELSKWCYGHFHKHNTEYIDGVKFCLLDMDRGVKLDTECIN